MILALHRSKSRFIRAITMLYCIFLMPWSMNALTDEEQSFHNYYSDGYRQFYTLRSIDALAERFSLSKPIEITKISFLASGDALAKARIRILGFEGGYPVPMEEKDIIAPLSFQKTKQGIETIELEIPIPLHIAQRQFFIVIDSSQGNLHILMDNVLHKPVCSNKTTQYYHQALRQEGQWKTGPYSFCIDVHYTQDEHSKDKELFSSDTKYVHIDTTFLQSLSKVNKSLALEDINNDGFLDMAYNGIIWINKQRTIEPLQEKQEICRAHVFIDIDNNGWKDILYVGHKRHNDTLHNATLVYNNRGTFSKEYAFTIQGLTVPVTVSTADMNNDSYTDILIAQTGYTSPSRQLILYYNPRSKTFEEYDDILPQMNAGGASISDINNDGKPDILIADMSTGKVRIFLNKGSKNFFEVESNTPTKTLSQQSYRGLSFDYGMNGELMYLTPMAGLPNSSGFVLHGKDHHIFPIGSGGMFTDIDGDGRKDYITTSSCHCQYAEIYHNNGGDYERMSMILMPDTVSATGEAMIADVDNDNDPDILFTGGYIPMIYRYTSAQHYHTRIEVESRNHNSIAGSRVHIYSNGLSESYNVMQGHGLLMQGIGEILVGTRDRTIDSVGVEWSGDGKHEEVFKDINETKKNILREGKGILRKKELSKTVSLHCYPNPFHDEITISYTMEHSGSIHIGLYDKQGSLLRTIVENVEAKSGTHLYQWHPENDGTPLMNGQYSLGLRINGVLSVLQEITYIH